MYHRALSNSRYLVNGFIRRLRQEAQQQRTGAVATVARSCVGKEVAKDFSHGAVFVGYVPEYCPSESPDFFLDSDDCSGAYYKGTPFQTPEPRGRILLGRIPDGWGEFGYPALGTKAEVAPPATEVKG